MILITTQLHSWQGEVCDHMPARLQRQKSDHTETLWLRASKLLLADPSRPHQSHQSGTWRDHTLWGHTSCASKPHWLTTIARHTDSLTRLLFQPHYFANNGGDQMWRKACTLWKSLDKKRKAISQCYSVSLPTLPSAMSCCYYHWWTVVVVVVVSKLGRIFPMPAYYSL